MSDRKEFRDLATPSAARKAIESLDLTPPTATVPLRDARGRVLAERIDAALDVPGFDRASMDGYAVRASDTYGADEADPAVLSLVGSVHAGEAPAVSVDPGAAVEVSTGAVLPNGADAVVMVERTDERNAADGDQEVSIRTAVAPGDNVMPAGADVAAGERALGPGTVLTPREIGLLSALGKETVPVRGRPAVGIVSTGDELVRPGEPLDSLAGEIYDVNSYAIATAVEQAGGDAELYPHTGDDPAEMERVLRDAADTCDLVLSSGSTSASAVDVVYRVIEQRGDLLLHGVAVKPGKPMLVGRLDGSAYVGLPGYPVSALTIFRTFVAPVIRAAAGYPEPDRTTVTGRMAVEERYAEGRHRLLPVGIVETGPDEASGLLVYPVDKGSGATTSLVEADGVIDVPADVEYLGADSSVEVQLFSPDVRTPTVFGVGEDDPALSRLIDRVERPRYLAVGSREGLRRLRNGVPDIAVSSAPKSQEVSVEMLGGWTREWGLVVPAGNPGDIDGIADLVDKDLRFVNRTTASSLRQRLENALAPLADGRGEDTSDRIDAGAGFGVARRAHESPPRAVAAGEFDVGLGLRATAERLDLGFVSLGTEPVRVLANPDRVAKPGVQELVRVLAEATDIYEELPGYEPMAG